MERVLKMIYSLRAKLDYFSVKPFSDKGLTNNYVVDINNMLFSR